MALFGQQLSDVQHYYYEQFYNVSLAIVVAQGGSGAAPNLGSLFMPWKGDVLVDGWVNCYYDSGATILNMDCVPTANIGVTNIWVGKRTESDGNGGWLSVPMYARWANLAKGTYFQFGAQFNCGAVNGRAVVNSFAGFLRAQAT